MLVVIDDFSRSLEVEIISLTLAVAVIPRLELIIVCLSMPTTLTL